MDKLNELFEVDEEIIKEDGIKKKKLEASIKILRRDLDINEVIVREDYEVFLIIPVKRFINDWQVIDVDEQGRDVCIADGCLDKYRTSKDYSNKVYKVGDVLLKLRSINAIPDDDGKAIYIRSLMVVLKQIL